MRVVDGEVNAVGVGMIMRIDIVVQQVSSLMFHFVGFSCIHSLRRWIWESMCGYAR